VIIAPRHVAIVAIHRTGGMFIGGSVSHFFAHTPLRIGPQI
jgi:hypothetical protein